MSINKISKMWKFYFWPIVWILIFLPNLIFSFSFDGAALIFSRIIGTVLLIFSLFLSSSGGRTLAKYGHKEEHETFWPDKFQTVGIFSCMRHPMHFGLALFPVSLALISGYVASILASGWGVVAALWFVIQIEEKDTIQRFGKEYYEYIKKVPPFSLRLICIKNAFNIWKN